MRKNLLLIAFVVCLFGLGNVQSQNTINLLKAGKTSYIAKPVVLDSCDNKGKKFKPERYLEPAVLPSNYNALEEIDLNKPLCFKSEKDFAKKSLYYKFTVSTYKKIEIELKATCFAKVSLDDELQDETTELQDSLSKAKTMKIEQDVEPGEHILAVSLLSPSGKDAFVGIDFVKGYKQENAEKGLTLQTMLCGENPYRTQISARGDLYMVKYSVTNDKGKTEYRMEVRKTIDNTVVFSDRSSISYSWMPSSSLLFYRRADKIYTLNPLNNEKVELCDNIPEGDVFFDKNEKFFILSHTTTKDNTKGDVRRIYMPDDRIPGWRDRVSLSLYTLEDKTLQPLTYSYRSVYLNDISPDGTRIVFTVSKDSITKRPFAFTSLYELNLGTMRLDTLIASDGFISFANYLYDCEHLAVMASNEAFDKVGLNIKKGQIANMFNNSLYIFDKKTRKADPVGKYFNPSLSEMIVRKDNIYLTCVDKDSINVYRYNIADKQYTLLDLKADIVHGFSIDENEKTAVYCGENYNKPKRIFTYKDGGNPEEVYFPKKQQFENMRIGKMEKWTFKKNNFEIDGRLYYPYNFDQSKKYPMIVYYYGGCEPTDRSFEMRYSAWLYTQQGYLVYVINPSGTIGYGQEFAARHVNAWGEYTADEIIEGVKLLCKAKSFIDKDHIGCMGASYGGFMTQLLMTKTDIFACAISHAGISNITSYWGEGYWGYSYSAAATADNYPWNNPKLYTRNSPLFNADKICKPLLLLHGTADTNVPIGESIQMYNALKILGKEVEFITIKGENHGIVDFDKRLKWNNTIYAWFAKWLKNENTWWDELYPKETY